MIDAGRSLDDKRADDGDDQPSFVQMQVGLDAGSASATMHAAMCATMTAREIEGAAAILDAGGHGQIGAKLVA